MWGIKEKSEWYEVDIPKEWPSSNIFPIKISGKHIAISKLDTQYFAYSNICPHAGATLSEDNTLIKDCIVCPLHQYKFNIKTGRNISGEGYNLIRYSIEKVNEFQLKIAIKG